MSTSVSTSPNPTLHAIRPGSPAAWSLAMRPKTLWIATIPVLVGTSLAFAATGHVDCGAALLALGASVVIQVISNLQNDVGYTARGAESARRIGLPRATATGLLAPDQVRRAIKVAILIAVALGLPLVARQGWPVLAMGLASIAGAVGYMGGPRPIAFTALGELTVLSFFGLVAVAGSAFVQMGSVPPAAWTGAVAIGMLAAAVLAVNNHRDTEHDRACGRQTFVVRFGLVASRRLYLILVGAPFVLAIATAMGTQSTWFALPLFAMPQAIRLVRDFNSLPAGPAWNDLLLRTVMLEVAFGLLLTAGGIATGLR